MYAGLDSLPPFIERGAQNGRMYFLRERKVRDCQPWDACCQGGFWILRAHREGKARFLRLLFLGKTISSSSLRKRKYIYIYIHTVYWQSNRIKGNFYIPDWGGRRGGEQPLQRQSQVTYYVFISWVKRARGSQRGSQRGCALACAFIPVHVSEEGARCSPAVDLSLAAGQVSCVAASLYSGTAEPGPQELTHSNMHGPT